jgi:hypothetical protein
MQSQAIAVLIAKRWLSGSENRHYLDIPPKVLLLTPVVHKLNIIAGKTIWAPTILHFVS